MALRVQHSKKAMSFFIDLGCGSKAFMEYKELPGRVLEFHHTETPFYRRGEGIAKLLVKEGFKYAAENKYKILPTCWYVLNYVETEASEEERKLTTIYTCTGSQAKLHYRELPGRVLDFDHTETPPDQQGKGVAKILVQEGLKYAAENNYKIKPTCPYVAKYVNEKGTAEEKKLIY